MLKLDFVGLSFVRSIEDIKLKKLINTGIGVIPKVETLSAVKNIDDILKNNGSILVDRGDLSTDVGLENIPVFQEYIIKKANLFGTDVYLATQFLKSMEKKPIPTIAEVNDLFNTFKRFKVKGIQLSEETAVGAYPQACLDWIKLVMEKANENYSMQKNIDNLAKT